MPPHRGFRLFAVVRFKGAEYLVVFVNRLFRDLVSKTGAENMNVNMQSRQGVGDDMIAGTFCDQFVKPRVGFGEGFMGYALIPYFATQASNVRI